MADSDGQLGLGDEGGAMLSGAVREPADDEAARSGSSAARMLGILDLFTVTEPVWSVDRLMAHLRLTRATVYRYVKDLQNAGFLASQGNGTLTLGPRCIELDRQVRLVDPLLRVCPAVIAGLREEVAGAIVVCRYYGDRVLAVLQDQVDPDIPLQMERGRPFPLFYGAPSRIIVAYLPPAKQKHLLLHHPAAIAAAGLGASWPQVKERLKAIRQAGHYVSSELSPLLVGAAAPIFVARDTVAASICLVRRKAVAAPEDVGRLIALATGAAAAISRELCAGHPGG